MHSKLLELRGMSHQNLPVEESFVSHPSVQADECFDCRYIVPVVIVNFMILAGLLLYLLLR